MKSFFTSTCLLLLSATTLVFSLTSVSAQSPPAGSTKGQHYDLVYGKYAFVRAGSLSGAPKGCYPALVSTLTKALHSGKIGYMRIRSSTLCHPTITTNSSSSNSSSSETGSDGKEAAASSSVVTTCYRINLDTGRAANVTIDPLAPIQNPQFLIGNRESAYTFPNVKGYEAIMVGWDKKQGVAMAQSQFVRTLVASMALSRFSNVEYQCGNMFVEVTATAYELLI
ncbi:MAG: hypothetical protein JOS17DRAFT_838314 [Linnemannia elongata]|nr:MAG: hypothetical protein JOS17DRAFT_838314 [Linnemannia elongata]